MLFDEKLGRIAKALEEAYGIDPKQIEDNPLVSSADKNLIRIVRAIELSGGGGGGGGGGSTVEFDEIPTQGSQKAVRSGGVYSAISDLSSDVRTNNVIIIPETNGTVTLTGENNTMYICQGEVTTLNFTAPTYGICGIRFQSGTVPTVATFTGVNSWLNGFDPLILESNKTYEVNILMGVGVAGWL